MNYNTAKYYIFSLGKICGPYPTYESAYNASKSKPAAEIWTANMVARYRRDGKVHRMR